MYHNRLCNSYQPRISVRRWKVYQNYAQKKNIYIYIYMRNCRFERTPKRSEIESRRKQNCWPSYFWKCKVTRKKFFLSIIIHFQAKRKWEVRKHLLSLFDLKLNSQSRIFEDYIREVWKVHVLIWKGYNSKGVHRLLWLINL